MRRELRERRRSQKDEVRKWEVSGAGGKVAGERGHTRRAAKRPKRTQNRLRKFLRGDRWTGFERVRGGSDAIEDEESNAG